MILDIYEKLTSVVGQDNVKKDEPMSEHTTFKIGGAADYFVSPGSADELAEVLAICDSFKIPYYIIGNGSNLLVKDKGFRGVIINTSRLNKIRVNDNQVTAEAGALLKDIAEQALNASLTGYEFASGIPGSIGGAVRMNAGAYDSEHAQVVEEIIVLDTDYKVIHLLKDECRFGYRHSIIQDEPYIVTEVVLNLEPGDKEDIKAKMDDLNARRKNKQPLEYPSAGSTFRRPEGYFAGKLIQDIGYKGKKIGGAQVSEKHSGFVINTGDATAEDILSLIEAIQKEVKRQFGVDIQKEVIVIGE